MVKKGFQCGLGLLMMLLCQISYSQDLAELARKVGREKKATGIVFTDSGPEKKIEEPKKATTVKLESTQIALPEIVSKGGTATIVGTVDKVLPKTKTHLSQPGADAMFSHPGVHSTLQ